MTTEPLPRAASAEHLTEALRRSGVLGDGRVRDVVVESSRPMLVSRIIRLRLTYDGAVGAPRSLILKTGLPNPVSAVADGGRREVEFYMQVAAAMPARLVPRCFDAAIDPDTKTWHLLLEDLSESHVIATEWPLPPTMEQCERILHALARLHAAWWDDPRLGVSVGTRFDAEAMNQYLQDSIDKFKIFTDRLGDRLPRERRDLYERFFDAAPRLLVARYHSHRSMTIGHGDAHVWNFFLPRDGSGDVRLFDWSAWRINVASTDLAYMMALRWYPDRRRRMEQPLLDHYHAALLEQGVRGYDRHALDDDYRMSALWQILIPVRLAAAKLPPVIWWSNLEQILQAVDDLGCRELLA